MYYYDQMLVWKQERLHFNSLPLEEFQKGSFFTTEQLIASCAVYLKEVLSLSFLEDYPTQLKRPLSIDDSKDFDCDTREWIIQSQIFWKKEKESLVSAYQRKLNDTLILNPWTLSEVRTTLLKTRSELASLLLHAKDMMEEDDLNEFFKYVRKEPDEIDRKLKYIPENQLPIHHVEYLRESLKNASVDFVEMREQDIHLNKLVEKLEQDDANRPLDYQYRNLWNKKVAWWMRTPEEHTKIIDSIVDALTLQDLIIIRNMINRFYGIDGEKLNQKYRALKEQRNASS